jgi:hypothetical protein
MIIIGIVLSVFGLGFFCWLLFTLAVYALPFFAGVTAALAAYHSGSGVIGAIIVAVLAGATTLAIGQIAFATVRSPLLRAAIGLLYAVPATIAGYHATLGPRLILRPITRNSLMAGYLAAADRRQTSPTARNRGSRCGRGSRVFSRCRA